MFYRPGKLLGLLLAALLLSLAGSLAQAAEFSAVIVTRSQDHDRQGKIYVKGDNKRREFTSPGGSMVSIVRGDKKVMWMLMPGQQTYREMPFDKEAWSKTMNFSQDEVSKKLVGRETINGYDTDKYETLVKTGHDELRGTMWVAKKLGVPIRLETADKSFLQEYKDIKEGGVDDAVFEIPAGYQKLTMPARPKMK